MTDYANRLKTVRTRMAEQNIGLMFLTPGANLFYLTGIRQRDTYRTDHNAYGDWAVGGYIGLDEGIVMTAPRMGGGYFEAEAQDKPWFEPVRIIHETEDALQVMRQVLSRFDLKDKKVAVDDHAWTRTMVAFRRLLPDADLVMASEIVAPMRMIKDQAELDAMRQAGRLTEAVFDKAVARLKLGVTEWDVESEIDYQFRLMGAEFNSFVTDVVFAGPGAGRGAIPATERRLRPGDSITFDMGCVYHGYCSDFGRTAFAGQPPDDYVKIHRLVLHAQREAMQAMKAGQVTGAQVNAIARGVIEAEGYGSAFTHRLGHGIGVTVHEPPWLDVVEQTVLQANMTFTVEPSIRIPNGFGSRVEDVVLVTEAGGVSLYEAHRQLYIIE